MKKIPFFSYLAASAVLALGYSAQAQLKDVTQPGDKMIASSSNSPGSEAVDNAIDGKPTKYLNFDTRTGATGKPSGFIVTPSIGRTVITGVTMQSANDAVERDPEHITIEGSNDDTVSYDPSVTWELISEIDNIPSWTSLFGADNRFKTQEFFFANLKPFKHYRWTVVETTTPNGCCFQIAEVELLGVSAPKDVTQPGDKMIASSSNSPGSEAVDNAIDGKPTKYLNFDTRTGATGKPSGFIVTPSIGRTVITGVTMQSANDAVERDPEHITIEGSNDDTVSYDPSVSWELISEIDNIPSWTSLFGADNRFKTQEFFFANVKPYKHYRWTVLETTTPNGCCFQIAEVELLGASAPKDVTQPGDKMIASSSNSPGSEAVDNAIDGKPTKYLNFDTRTGATGKPSGFIVTPSIGRTVITGVTMQSANDAVERDPEHITIEGSNDDTVSYDPSVTWELISEIDNIPSWTSLFGADNRFKTQEFFFANFKPFKHYRWTVLETTTPNGCCFQIAEVELVAVTQGNPDSAAFTLQPVNTPVLEGESATFFVQLNGPWTVQWKTNGVAIAGATGLSYTSEPVTAANAGLIYTVEIVGQETSSPVQAVLFSPDSVKSIGISFIGGGANGTPTSALETDIAGLQPQAYWNNVTGGSGTSATLVDSDNAPTEITFEWASSGQWGAGTGSANGTQRILNGLVYANPNLATPAALRFSNVPAGNHAVIAYFVGIPLQFQNADYTITGATSETIYTRVINADEYNAAPGFYRGTSTDPAVRTLATYVRFDVSPSAEGTIVLNWSTTTTGFDRGVPVNAIQLVLNAPVLPPAPVITAQPQPTVAGLGDNISLAVTATGGETYQWLKGGKAIVNGGNISGATGPSLNISGFVASDAGIYSVAVFNQGGSALSKNAAVRLSGFLIAESAVAYFQFNETTGTTADNAIASGSDGIVNEPAVWGPGKIGNALSFDGASTYVFVPNYTKANRELSASCWVNVADGTATPVAFVRNAERALGLGLGIAPNTPAGQFELGLLVAGDGSLNLTAALGAGPNFARATAGEAFPLGSWQHVAFSADGAQLRLYLNGVEVAATDYSSAINPPDIAYLSIGARLAPSADDPPVLGPDATTPAFLSGGMDDLALWIRGISATEVGLIFAAGNLGQPAAGVVVPRPVQPGRLTITRSGSNVTVSWNNGRLQSASNVSGPYTDVAGAATSAASPKTEAAEGTAKYYRTINQ